MVGPAYSVIVPVHDEAAILPQSLPALLAAIGDDAVELIYVCNGCTDDSADVIGCLAGDRARVITLPGAGKAAALNAGDGAATAFPRFYIDADVTVTEGRLSDLARALSGETELVSPSLVYDPAGASPAARGIAAIWSRLPHGQGAGFHCLLGLSHEGRARWGAFPDVIGDDAFINASIPPDGRKIVPALTATVRQPRSFWSWVRVRARWLQGDRQIAAMGLWVPKAEGQGAALLRLLLHPATMLQAAAYVAVRLLAFPVSRWNSWTHARWFRDRG